MRRLMLVAILLIAPAAVSAQFAFNIGGESLDQGFAIAATPPWNVSHHFIVVTGEFRQSADFDPGPDEHILTAHGSRDVFVASYTQHSGALRWAFNIGGPGVDAGHGVAIDDDGNVYVVGTFRQSADFDPGPGEHVLTSNGQTDAFLASYTADGDFRWAFNLGGENFDQGHAVTVTPWGAVCATGSFRETVDFDPGEEVLTFTSAGSYNIWIACYTLEAGDLLWAYGTGGPGDFDRGWAIASDSSGVYFTGDFTGTTHFDPDGEAEELTALGLNDIFVAAYEPDGTFRWAHRAGSHSNDVGNRGNAIVAGPFHHGAGGDYVLVSGDFIGAAQFPDGSVLPNAGGRDAFLALFTADGDFVQAFPIGGPGNERGTGLALVGAAPGFGLAALTGYFDGTVDLKPDGGHQVTSPGGRSFFVATYDVTGSAGTEQLELWEGIAIGGPLNDQSYGIAGSDQLFLTGSFRQTIDFPDGSVTAVGPLDAFVAAHPVSLPPTPSTEPGAGIWGPRLRLAGANPFSGNTRVAVASDRGGDVRVEVVDLLGRRVAVLFDGVLGPGIEQVLTIPRLPPGMYVVRAHGGSGVSAVRVTSAGR